MCLLLKFSSGLLLAAHILRAMPMISSFAHALADMQRTISEDDVYPVVITDSRYDNQDDAVDVTPNLKLKIALPCVSFSTSLPSVAGSLLASFASCKPEACNWTSRSLPVGSERLHRSNRALAKDAPPAQPSSLARPGQTSRSGFSSPRNAG